MFSNELTIENITEFLVSYDDSNAEVLLLWLRQYNILTQMKFIALIKRPYLLPETVWLKMLPETEHLDCACRSLYDTFDVRFTKRVPLKAVSLCVPHNSVPQEQQRRQQTEEAENSSIQLEAENQTYEFKEEVRELVYIQCKSLPGTTGDNIPPIQNDKRTINDLSKIWNNKYRMFRELNVLELYTLYRLGRMSITYAHVERLLPEHYRSAYRNAHSAPGTVVGIQQLLHYIYSFHCLNKVPTCSIRTLPVFRLTPTIKVERNSNVANAIIRNTNEYFIQPNLKGYRFSLIKYDKKIYLFNQHGFKVYNKWITASSFLHLGNFNIEIILIGYRDNRYFMDINVYSDNVAIIVSDIFVWNEENLLTLSYEQRYSILCAFVDRVGMESMMSIKNVPDIHRLTELYECELLSTKQSHYNGFVFRNKTLKYQQNLIKIKIESCRYDIIERNVIQSIIVRNYDDMPIRENIKISPHTINITGSIVPFANSRYKAAFVVYRIVNNFRRLSLCVFDGLKFRPYCCVNTIFPCCDKNKCINNTNDKGACSSNSNRIIVGNRTYSYIVVNLYFNRISNETHLIDDVLKVDFRPDLSVLDCISLHDLMNFADKLKKKN